MNIPEGFVRFCQWVLYILLALAAIGLGTCITLAARWLFS